MTYYKFVKWDAAPIETVLMERTPKALAEYDNGNKKAFNDLQIATTDPYYKCGGWCFPLAPYLRRYWVKTKYYGILEYFAVNKTAIRKALKSEVIEIVEVK
jgi:hypothetical protein